jgi:5-methylcytosine-specific restriction protein A
VPEHVAREIQRESGKRLVIAPGVYRVDPNSLRTTGRITQKSAALLDALLDSAIPVQTDVDPGVEGGRQEARHQRIERSSAVRAGALQHHGTDCAVCGFSFAQAYGSLGDGFAEVHHLKPLASLKERVLVNPAADVIVVCANCHRMLHRNVPPLTPDALREVVATVAQ